MADRTDWWNDPAMVAAIAQQPPQRLQPVLFAPGQPAAAAPPVAAAPQNFPVESPEPPLGGPRLPQVFNAGVQSSPDIAIPAAAGVAQPPGYRRTISAEGAPTFFQPVRPEERGVNGQDLLRQGTTVAEIQAAHPGWSATQQHDLYSQLQQDAARASRQNFAIGNEAANQNAGIMSNADRAAAQIAAAHATQANAAQTTANYGTSRNRLYDQIAAGIAANGGTASDLRGALAAAGFRPGFVRSDEGATPNPAAQAGAASAPTVDPETAREDFHRTLDQHLRSAASLPAPQRGQQDLVPSLPPISPKEGGVNNRDAITNFVHSVSAAGLLTPANLPAIRAYMTQRMRAQNVDPWFQQSFGLLNSGSAHQGAVDLLQNAMRGAGEQVGNERNLPARIGDYLNLRNLFR